MTDTRAPIGARHIFGVTPKNDTFTYYRVTLQLTGKLIGGIPKDPDTIRAWVAARIRGGADLVLEQTVSDTIEAIKTETAEALTAANPDDPVDPDQVDDPDFDVVLDQVSRQVEGGNGFKHMTLPDGRRVPALEGRCVKAMIREATNIAYPGLQWEADIKKRLGVKKGAKSTLVERLFILEDLISLAAADGDGTQAVEILEQVSGTEQRIKHVSTPMGPRSAINVVDFIERPRLTFHVAVVDDFMSEKMLGRVWQIAELNGLGADRARGDGVFQLAEYTRLDGPPDDVPVYDVSADGEKLRDYDPEARKASAEEWRSLPAAAQKAILRRGVTSLEDLPEDGRAEVDEIIARAGSVEGAAG